MIESLDYRSPPKRPHHRLFSTTAFLATCITLAFLWLVLLLVVPRFEYIFKDFGTKLPLLTQKLLDLARFAKGVSLILPVSLPIAAGFTIAAIVPYDPSKRRRYRNIAIYVAIATVFLICIVITIALFLPMISIVTVISSPPTTHARTPAPTSIATP